ncbi:hypothetical protein JIN83_02325 [Verrucomicrobiaceae bacterium 5K15]|uniref:Uncharacterized protein n=1 Tax=Oceaniferula flava TaxID=2800421 RepID=A0AAE2VCW4_9BACT|nr:hypothetical protein [Oceaniferula flavus]
MFLLGSFCCCFSAERSQTIDYSPLRTLPADSPKLNKILTELAQKQAAERNNTKRFKITQHIDHSHYLAYSPSVMGRNNRLGIIRLELLERDSLIADDTWITVHATETSKVYQYTTVLGAKSTVPIWKEVELPEITNDSILQSLKRGNLYTIEKYSDKMGQCKKCIGSGKALMPDQLHVRKCVRTAKGVAKLRLNY